MYQGCLPTRRGLPLVEAAGRQQAAPAARGLAERGLVEQAFGARVAQLVADAGVARPVRHQAPAHEFGHALAFARLVDHGHRCLRCDVLASREGRDAGDAEARHQRLRIVGNDVAAAHAAILARVPPTGGPGMGARLDPPSGRWARGGAATTMAACALPEALA